MPNVILPNLGIELPDVGSDQDTWGDILNSDLQILDKAVQYDVISKTLAGVDVTLTDVEAASAVINLTGTLTANVNVIVPATPVRVYLVRNQTSGAFTVTVKTAAGTGTPVQQGTSSLVYSDGTNIIQGATSVNGSFAVSGALTAGSATVTGALSATNLSYTGTLTGGTGVINIGSGQIYKDASGSVGLGTTSPLAFLDARGPIQSNAGYYISGNAGGGFLFTKDNTPLRFGTNDTERFRIDTAGNAGLGFVPSAWSGQRGFQVSGVGSSITGSLYSPGDVSNGFGLAHNAYYNAGWKYVSDISFSAARYEQNNGSHTWFTAPSGTAGNPITFTQRLALELTGNLLPGETDNIQNIGSASNRWATIFAGTGTINTSDAREKTIVSALTLDEINAAKQLSKEIGTYKFLASIQAKGSNARTHIGMTVQRAIEIMEANNLNPFVYGFICHDVWQDEFVEHPEIQAIEAQDAVFDEDGNLVSPAVEAVEYRAAYTEQVKWAGDRYAFRYDQLNMFIAAGIEARLAALEAK